MLRYGRASRKGSPTLQPVEAAAHTSAHILPRVSMAKITAMIIISAPNQLEPKSSMLRQRPSQLSKKGTVTMPHTTFPAALTDEATPTARAHPKQTKGCTRDKHPQVTSQAPTVLARPPQSDVDAIALSLEPPEAATHASAKVPASAAFGKDIKVHTCSADPLGQSWEESCAGTLTDEEASSAE